MWYTGNSAVDVAQRKSAGLWNRWLRVQPPSSTLLCAEAHLRWATSLFALRVSPARYWKTFPNIWVEAIPKERKDLLGLLLDEVLIDVVEDRIVCVKLKASFVALFQ